MLISFSLSLVSLVCFFEKKKKMIITNNPSLSLKKHKEEKTGKRKKRKIKAGRYGRKTLNHNYPLN